MTTYKPEGWLVLKIDEGDEGIWYRIFGIWHGGYLEGDKWRLSSGSQETPHEEDNETIVWPQHSGSDYVLHKSGMNRTTFYTSGVLDGIAKKMTISGLTVEFVNILDEKNHLLPMDSWSVQTWNQDKI